MNRWVEDGGDIYIVAKLYGISVETVETRYGHPKSINCISGIWSSWRSDFQTGNECDLMIELCYRVRSTAFHEAGHTFAAVHFGIPFSKVSILNRTDYEIREGEILGQLTRTVNKPDYFGKLAEAKEEAVLALSGPLAECFAYPGQQEPGLQTHNIGDLSVARSILRFATTPCTPTNSNPFRDEDLAQTSQQINQLLEECGRAAEVLVNRNQATITRIAEALLERWEVTADEVMRIVSGNA